MSNNVFWVVARLPQRLNLMFFEIFTSLRWNKFKKTLILAFEANSALSRENETKIVKITHSGISKTRNPSFGYTDPSLYRRHGINVVLIVL